MKSNSVDGLQGMQKSGGVYGAASSGVARTIYFHGVAMKETDLLWKGLQKVYGIGPTLADEVCRQFSRTRYTLIHERRDSGRLSKVERWLSDHYRFETERRRKEEEVLKRYVSSGSVRGIRLRQGRPVRGQRTSTNAKTAKRLNRVRAGVGSTYSHG